MESITSISVCTRLSTYSIVQPANKNMNIITSEVYTVQPHNGISPTSRYLAKHPLQTAFRSLQWLLCWMAFMNYWNIIFQRLVQMYPYPHKVSPISDTLQCWTGMPLWLEKAPNLQQYEYGQLVLGNTESTSCGSSKYAWDLCLRNDTVAQFFS